MSVDDDSDRSDDEIDSLIKKHDSFVHSLVGLSIKTNNRFFNNPKILIFDFCLFLARFVFKTAKFSFS